MPPCGGVVPVYGARFIPLEDTIYGHPDFPSAAKRIDVITLVDAVSGDLTLHPGVRLAISSDWSRQW